jgi:hypothetical protein
MKDKKIKEHDDSSVADLKSARIRKRVLEETDPDCRDAVESFLEKFKNDTLTGL